MNRSRQRVSSKRWGAEALLINALTALSSYRLYAGAGKEMASIFLLLNASVASIGAAVGADCHGLRPRKCEDQVALVPGSALVPLLCSTYAAEKAWTGWDLRFWLSLLHALYFLLVTGFPVLSRRRYSMGAVLGIIGYGIFGSHAVLACLLFPIVFWEFTYEWERSFTLGEATITASALCLCLTELPGVGINSTLSNSHGEVDGVIICGVLGVIAAILLLTPIARRPGQEDSKKLVISIIGFFGIGVYPLLCSYLRTEPFGWILTYLASHLRIGIVSTWLTILIVVILWFPPQKLNTSLIIARKFYHLLAIVMFLAPAFLDMELLRLAFAVALVGLVVVEILCIPKSLTLSMQLSKYMGSLTDKRDRGLVVVSHIYLLLGCAFPMWLEPLPCRSTSLSGLVCLGVYDAVASVVGSTLGKIRIFWTRKTVEGSIGGAVTALGFSLSVSAVLCHEDASEFGLKAASITLMALFEICTTQNDNLVLPIYYFACLRLICP
ncbi:hypothetical protein NDN08_008374 [Rhodosorus marinus]|uniref:dolichol kinase n=1 Tax=Rhodosorus marinus TaxID=101924 RepID=A0AAV8V062_9RHOD|nr:hypothetical protein NDN08_008374 [Rhodosorus marinus]